MNTNELKRIGKLEEKINKLVTEMGYSYYPVEYDVVPFEKMLEILAYRSPTNISSWKYGRDYERHRTIFEQIDPSLPYECVIFGDPCRAYLMGSNTFAVQALVMAHVVGHCAFFKENRWFSKSRIDLMNILAEANHRFIEYERIYGLADVERTVDAGHAIQFHSSPFDVETEDEKRKRVYEQMKQVYKPNRSEFADITLDKDSGSADTDTYNIQLWRTLKQTTPVEPTEDLLRYIIDNSTSLEDWQKDILEVLRIEGQYYWPIMKTRHMDEGFATYVHEKVMHQLFLDGDLTPEEHGEYNYSNSLVKANQRMAMNPYKIGSHIWKDIERRWDKGQHGPEWDACNDFKVREEWDTHAMAGKAKVKEVLETYTDWMFYQDFLTTEIIEELDLYIYLENVYDDGTIEYVRSGHTSDQVRQIIINSFTNNGQPKIEVTDGNAGEGQGYLFLNHVFTGAPLDQQYTMETMKHICYLWGRDVLLKTVLNEKEVVAHVRKIK